MRFRHSPTPQNPERRAAMLPVSTQAANDALAFLEGGTFRLDEEHSTFAETQPQFFGYLEGLMQTFPTFAAGARRDELNDGVSTAHLLLRMAGPNAEARGLEYFFDSLGRRLPTIKMPTIETIEGRMHSLEQMTLTGIAHAICAPEFAPGIVGGLYEPVQQKAAADYPMPEAFVAGAALLASAIELQATSNSKR